MELDIVQLRKDVDEIRIMVSEIHTMLRRQEKSMNNLDKHVDFINDVYQDVVRSPLEWIRGKLTQSHTVASGRAIGPYLEERQESETFQQW